MYGKGCRSPHEVTVTTVQLKLEIKKLREENKKLKEEIKKLNNASLLL